MSTETIRLLTPEIVLMAVAVLIYVAGAFVETQKAWSPVAGAGILLAAMALSTQTAAPVADGPVTMDSLAYFVRWLALGVGALFVVLTSRPLSGGNTSEYVGSLLLALAGLMLTACATELVLLFLGLELISIPTYILLFLGRRAASSEQSLSYEATTKYFFLSILASAMLLYGFSFLYGAAAATRLAEIADALSQQGTLASGPFSLATLAMLLIFAGLCFKIAAVPFHFYAPDVYQGTTHPNAALLSVVPKAAGLIVLVRILVLTLPGTQAQIVAVISMLTMTLGNVMALWQDNVRRLLAYSSVAHAGYMLIGLAVAVAMPGGLADFNGLASLLFYLSVYAIATIGTFAALLYLGRDDAQIDSVDELAGLGSTRPLVAAAMAVFLFSLAGIPPLAGFWGKLGLFLGALGVEQNALTGEYLRPWFLTLAVIGVLNAAVAAAYYLRIVAVMYFRTPLAVPKAQGGAGPWCVVVVCAVLTLGVGLMPRPLWNESIDAGRVHETAEQ